MTNREVYIPDDLLLNCLARVSRLYYPILSLVSKRFRSIVTSIELYQIRTLLRRTENCLYVRLRFGSESPPRWFALCRRPTRIHTPTTPKPNPNPNSRWFTSCFSSHRNLTSQARKEDKKSTEYILFSTPTTKNNSSLCVVTCTTIGPSINMVSSYINGALMAKVFLFMDSRSNIWYDAQNMTVARKRPIMSVLDGKLYVVEGCKDSNSSNLIEFFDPKTQIWKHVPCPSAEILGRIVVSKTLVIDGRLYVFGDNNVVYIPNDNRWYKVPLDMFSILVTRYSSCVVGNVCYIVLSGLLLWYNSVERSWRFLTGLGNLPRLRTRREFVRLVDFGGKLAIVWEKKVSGIGSKKTKTKTIWCAVIAFERRNAQEIYGKVEWCDGVLTVPKSSSLLEFSSIHI